GGQDVEVAAAGRHGAVSRLDRVGKGKLDAVEAFVSKARPRHSTLFSAVEGSASADMPASIFEESAVQAQPSVLVPVQKYVAAKRRQLIFGLILGICISSMFAMAALKFSNYLRQSRGPEKVAEESRAVR